MKYYDVETKKYHETQNADCSRIPFSNGALLDAFDRAASGEVVDVNTLDLPNFFDKEVIRKNLLYIELKSYVNKTGHENRIAEIQAILSPKEKDEITSANEAKNN
ncbi:MAG: hypothetical protein RR334_03930 [Clostridia bacterium]